jgi:hypothetical protein
MSPRSFSSLLDALENSASSEWPSPATEAEIDRVEHTYGGVPTDLRKLWERSSSASFGIFDPIHSPDQATTLFDLWSGYLFRLYDDMFPGKGPDDPIGIVTIPVAEELEVEVGGTLDGRVFRTVTRDFLERPYFNHVAWSLHDAMSCTRDLMEAGWFTVNHRTTAFANPDVDVDVWFRRLEPILLRWGCSAAVASLPTRYWSTPPPPVHWQPATPHGSPSSSRPN